MPWPCRIKRLPAELMLNVFQSQGRLKDILKFSSSCRLLNAIWRSNVNSITDAVFPKEYPCFTDAKLFLEAEDLIDPALSGPSLALEEEGDQQEINYATSLKRLQRLYAHAHDAVQLCNLHSDWVMERLINCRKTEEDGSTHQSNHPIRLVTVELARFTHCYYFIRVCVCSFFSAPLRTRCLNQLRSMGLSEIYLMSEIAFWLCRGGFIEGDNDYLFEEMPDTYEWKLRKTLGIFGPDGTDLLVSPEWEDALTMIQMVANEILPAEECEELLAFTDICSCYSWLFVGWKDQPEYWQKE
ncbi:MAG: hypothetical protein M1819_001153 [Sarea resinae]|nr:MAG: hypothetical protein M1819_001153 [Sarea resinae]